MKEVRRKSFDAATNAMLVKAMRSKTEVIWDRAEVVQPQCGFGRLGICCADCNDGPCRINPFASVAQETVCGRAQSELIACHFLKAVTDGAAAFVSLAKEFRAGISGRIAQTLLLSTDCMLAPADYTARLYEIGQIISKVLVSLRSAKDQVYKQNTGVATTTVNLGSLKYDTANIVLHGHVAPHIARSIMTEAAKRKIPLNVTGMCGGEVSFDLPVLTNYASQEMPLLTEAVDLLVIGSQCVMPATVSLAEALNIPVIAAAKLNDRKKIKEVIERAASAFQFRKGREVYIPAYKEKVYTGYTAFNSRQLFEALKVAFLRGTLKGLAYIGGCGNIAKTQDVEIINLAKKLLSDGYVIVTAGCAGTALAKAGMCSPDYSLPSELTSISGIGMPPALHIGSCHDAGEFIKIAEILRGLGIPAFAAMQELRHNKVLATAIAFASEGIKTYVDLGETMTLPKMDLPGHVLPMGDLEQLMQNSATVASTR